jgi:hypothetical protein
MNEWTSKVSAWSTVVCEIIENGFNPPRVNKWKIETNDVRLW